MTLHISHVVAGVALAAASWVVQAQEGDPIGRFDVARYQVEGNTLLPQAQVDALLSPFTGKSKDFGDVQRALEALESAYRARGYNVVQVVLPEQELNQGVVKLTVVETKIGKVTVQGNKVFGSDNIRRSLPGLREGSVPHIADISASLRMANENPAKKVSLQLQGGDRDDEVNALLKVDDDKDWRVGANVDNTGSGNTGRSHVGLTYQNANMFDRDQVLTLQYTTTLEKPSQVSVWGLGYHIPLYGWGDAIDLFASYSNVDSGTVVAGLFNLKVSGKGTVLGGRYTIPLERSGEFDGRLVFGFDYKAYKNDVLLLGAQIGNDVTVRPASVAWSGSWTLPKGDASASVTAIHNIPGGDKGRAADFNLARAGAADDYKMLRLAASYSHGFASGWQLRALANAQYSDDALVPGEQFGAGGGGSVRGFSEREVSNDKGLGLSLEAYTPNLCGGIQRFATQCRVVGFVDAAHAARNKPLPGEQTSTTIAGAGLGLRVMVERNLMMQLDWGRVIKGGGVRDTGDSRMHFTMNLSY